MSFAHRLKASSCSADKRVVNDTGNRDWSATGDGFSAGDRVISWLTVNNTFIVPCGFHAGKRSRQTAVFEGQTHCHQQRISLLDPTAGDSETGWRRSLRQFFKFNARFRVTRWPLRRKPPLAALESGPTRQCQRMRRSIGKWRPRRPSPSGRDRFVAIGPHAHRPVHCVLRHRPQTKLFRRDRMAQ
jgi:hypothetical protein